MYRRPFIGLTFLWLAIARPAFAQITAFWEQVPITPQAIASDAQLASMQCWDLMTTTSGDWASAGLRAVLPPGNFFYTSAQGGNTRPSPATVQMFPHVEFDTFVTSPSDTGVLGHPTFSVGIRMVTR